MIDAYIPTVCPVHDFHSGTCSADCPDRVGWEDLGTLVSNVAGMPELVCAMKDEIERLTKQRDEAYTALRAVAHAIGVCHCHDFGCAPGPTEEILGEVSRLQGIARTHEERSTPSHAMHRRAQAAESRAVRYEQWCWVLLAMWGRAKNRIAERDAHLVERVARMNPRRPPEPMLAEHGFHCDDCDRDDTPIVCETGGGESPESTYRCVPCEMLYLLNMQEWGQDLMSEDRERAVERARVDTLRLVYIGASCADEQANALATEHSGRVELWAHLVATAHRSRGVAIAVLNALAEVGDETAIGLLAGDL